MLCFSSDLWFPAGLEECEAGAVFCFVTSEQKRKQRLVATVLGFVEVCRLIAKLEAGSELPCGVACKSVSL